MQTNVLKAEIVGSVFKNRAVNLQREKKREKATWRVGLTHHCRPPALTPPGATGAARTQHQPGLGHRPTATLPSDTHRRVPNHRVPKEGSPQLLGSSGLSLR